MTFVSIPSSRGELGLGSSSGRKSSRKPSVVGHDNPTSNKANRKIGSSDITASGGAAFFVVSAGRKSEVDEQTKGSQMEDRARTFAYQTFVGRRIGLAARLASTLRSVSTWRAAKKPLKESMLAVFSMSSPAN